MQPLSLQNRCNARESCRAGQIAQLKMAKTLCKGDEKLYIPKYCCLSFSADYRQKGVFSFCCWLQVERSVLFFCWLQVERSVLFFCWLQVERSVLQPASRHTCYASELGAELVWGGWAGRDALQHLRCRYASPIEWLPIRQKDSYIQHTELHLSWVWLSLNTWFWTIFHGAQCSFCFFNSSSVCSQQVTKQTVCWMLADFLSMTPLSSRCFMYPLDSCILQIAFFSIQTFSMRASVLLVFLLLKTTESGCSQGSIDPALWLLNSSTQKLYKLFLFLFIYLFIYFFWRLTSPNSHL